LTPASITNITAGKTYPSLDLLLVIAKMFNIDIRDLFTPTMVNYTSQLDEAKSLIRKGCEILEKL
jgi:DNA-binding XRE family transcriptional regulator